MNKKRILPCLIFLCFVLILSGCEIHIGSKKESIEELSQSYSESIQEKESTQKHESFVSSDTSYNASDTTESQSDIPVQKSNETYIVINNNEPKFTKSEITNKSFENYSELDELGRCGPATACVGKDLMPTEKRGSIGMIKPTGWHTIKFDFVDGKYLYNRCHLIGYQLSGENANEKNLITGTRYFNTIGMLPFENQVADYVKETGNHVMYRVIPIFENDDLVAKGVTMEAYSVEDNGTSVSFNVFVYNTQPGVTINYHTGEANLTEEKTDESSETDNETRTTYIINKNTKKFHKISCEKVQDMLPKNKKEYKGSAKELIEQGYTPCQTCRPDEE